MLEYKELKKMVSEMSLTCENKQYILQDGGGGHLRFMHEQYLRY